MKILFILSTLILALQAETATMTLEEHSLFQNATSHPFLQLEKKQLTQLVKKETGEEIVSEEMTHSGDILYYEVPALSDEIETNALDSTFLKKVKKDD